MVNFDYRFESVAGKGKGKFIGGLSSSSHIFRDNETGVLYLRNDFSTVVLMNRDGTPMIDEEYVREKGW